MNTNRARILAVRAGTLPMHRCWMGWSNQILICTHSSHCTLLFRTPRDGTNKMRGQKCDIIKEDVNIARLYSHEDPAGGSGVSACRPPTTLPIVSPTRYEKILRPSDRKERAGSVWEKKGTERKRRRERGDEGSGLHAALVRGLIGGATEPNSMWRGSGICKTLEISETDCGMESFWCKGVWLP